MPRSPRRDPRQSGRANHRSDRLVVVLTRRPRGSRTRASAFGTATTCLPACLPAWLEVGICVVCFVAFGTDEETYLTLYAAGVFILLSITGWATVNGPSPRAW